MDEESKQLIQNKREKILQHKTFLKSLLTTPSRVRKILNNADNAEITVLLELLHWFACGEIGVSKKLHNRIQKSPAASLFRKHFVRVEGFDKLLKNTRSKKLLILIALKTLIPLFIVVLKKEV